ncbi:hypothetical protein M427DRAFT_193166 [Gonapodya prolifera JEL478]|uniref:Uncharacterized protein n=1 Tax=Gonapodya prolifera (strain JEL478) TaxID=1344416 RepID=A0A139A0X2_GONPJ|nr:hypothetical protein M427DRAFT_193166 [Gonapodya prolifera JEL478]|eukprot:KXS10003.1 hypothetical protein M427DRAFT_193166 [Gonapodya prolifera JEL478]
MCNETTRPSPRMMEHDILNQAAEATSDSASPAKLKGERRKRGDLLYDLIEAGALQQLATEREERRIRLAAKVEQTRLAIADKAVRLKCAQAQREEADRQKRLAKLKSLHPVTKRRHQPGIVVPLSTEPKRFHVSSNHSGNNLGALSANNSHRSTTIANNLSSCLADSHVLSVSSTVFRQDPQLHSRTEHASRAGRNELSSSADSRRRSRFMIIHSATPGRSSRATLFSRPTSGHKNVANDVPQASFRPGDDLPPFSKLEGHPTSQHDNLTSLPRYSLSLAAPRHSSSRQRSNSLAPASPVDRVFGSERAWLSFHDRYIKGWEIGGGSKGIEGAQEFLESVKVRATKSAKRRGAEMWNHSPTISANPRITTNEARSGNQSHRRLLLTKTSLLAHAERNKTRVSQFITARPEFGQVFGKDDQDEHENEDETGGSESEEVESEYSGSNLHTPMANPSFVGGIRASGVWESLRKSGSAAQDETRGMDGLLNANIESRILDDNDVRFDGSSAVQQSSEEISSFSNNLVVSMSDEGPANTGGIADSLLHTSEGVEDETTSRQGLDETNEISAGRFTSAVLPWEPLSMAATVEGPRTWTIIPRNSRSTEAPDVDVQYLGKVLRSSTKVKFLEVERDVGRVYAL